MKLAGKYLRPLASGYLSFLAVCLAVRAQETPTLRLKNTEVKPLRSLVDEPLLHPVRCDSSGNIYVRTYQYPDPLAAPIRRFTQDGKRLQELSLTQSAEFKERRCQIRDFQISSSGHTFVLVVSRKKNGEGEVEGPVDVSVVDFDEHGELRTKTMLETPPGFIAGQLGVFPDGKFLVGGLKEIATEDSRSDKAVPPRKELYIAAFNQDGHRLNEFRAKEPPIADTSPKASKWAKATPGNAKQKQRSLSEAPAPDDVVIGEDGSAYFFHKVTPPTIYVLSENGEFIRQFSIQRPSAKAAPWWIRALPGLRLLVNFIEDEGDDRSAGQTQYFYVIDAPSGTTIFRYKLLSTDGGVFACYSEPHEFVFLGADPQGFTTIIRTAPK